MAIPFFVFTCYSTAGDTSLNRVQTCITKALRRMLGVKWRHYPKKSAVRTQGCLIWPANQAVAKLGTVPGAQIHKLQMRIADHHCWCLTNSPYDSTERSPTKRSTHSAVSAEPSTQTAASVRPCQEFILLRCPGL